MPTPTPEEQTMINALLAQTDAAQVRLDAAKAAWAANPEGTSMNKYGQSNTYAAYLSAQEGYREVAEYGQVARANILGISMSSSGSGGALYGKYTGYAQRDSSGSITGYSSTPGYVGASAGISAAAPTPITLMAEGLPMAQIFNTAAIALNAARQPGATQAGVQNAVSTYADFTYGNYNPKSGDIIQRVYMPEGNFISQEFKNVKVGMALDAENRSTGEFSLYTLLPNGRMNIDPDTGVLSNWILRGGGGRNFLQSGTGGFAAATPAVYEEGGVGTGKFKTPDVMAPGVMQSGISAGELIAAVKAGTAGDLYSRLGAEAYGGVVSRLDGRTLGNITYEDVTNRAAWNFASYVNPTDVNLSKAALPGVSIPWSITDSAPALFALTTKGGVGNPIAVKPFEAYFNGATVAAGRIVGSGEVAAGGTTVTVSETPQSVEGLMAAGVLPKPFTNGVSNPALVAASLDAMGYTTTPVGSAPARTPSAATGYAPPDTPTTRLESLFSEYGHITDNTLGFIPGLVGIRFAPFADVMKSAGLAEPRPVLSAANMVSGKANTAYQQDVISYDLAAAKLSLDATAKANTNAERKWITGQASLDIYKQNVASYTEAVNRRTALYADVQSALSEGVKSGAYYYDLKGNVQINPDNLRPYGAASDWNAGFRGILSGLYGITPEQFRVNAELRNIEDRNNPIVAKPEWGIFGGYFAGEMQKGRNLENFVFGFNREIATNPEGLVASAGSGLQIYALTFGAGEILAAGRASAEASVAAGVVPTRAASTAVSLTNIAENPVVTYGVPTIFLGSAAWQTTEGFTLSSSEASMRAGSGAAHLAAMTYGGIAPSAVSELTTLARNAYPILDTQSNMHFAHVRTEDYFITNENRPNPETTHAIGERSVTSVTDPYHTTLVAFDRDFALPYSLRGTPETIATRGNIINSELLANDVMAGANVYATSGTRSINLRGELPYGSNALGDVVVTGGLRVAEVRSPRTMAETVELGGALSNFNGRSIEQNVNALLEHDMGRTTPITGQRNLGGYMYREDALSGMTLYESVDWIANPSAGTTHLFNQFDINRHFGQYTVEKTGGVGGDYSYSINAHTSNGRTTGIGNIEITGSMTPEARIVAYSQEMGRGINPATNEWSIGFNRRGEAVSVLEGEHDVATRYYETVHDTIPNIGDIGTLGHSHPLSTQRSAAFEFKLDLLGDSSLGIRPDWKFTSTRQIIERNMAGEGRWGSYPSRPDVRVYDNRDTLYRYPSVDAKGFAEREVLVSSSGVRIFYPDQTGGWGHYANLDLSEVHSASSILMEHRFGVAAERAGVTTRFYRTNEAYISPESYVERVRDVPAEIAAVTPDYIGRIFRDQTYREILGDPNLEFSVEHGRTPNTPSATPAHGSLLTSGSNLGRNNPRYSEPPLPSSPYDHSLPTSRTASTPRVAQQLVARQETGAVARDEIRAYSFEREQSKLLDESSSRLPVRSPYQMPIVQQMVKPVQTQGTLPVLDTVKAYSFAQDSSRVSDQASDRIRAFTPYQQQVRDVVRTQEFKQTPAVMQITDKIQEQIRIPFVATTQIVIPEPIVFPKPIIPVIPIIPIPWLPPFGGGGGFPGGVRKPGWRKVELFTYAPKNLKGLLGRPKGRTPAIKKRRT